MKRFKLVKMVITTTDGMKEVNAIYDQLKHQTRPVDASKYQVKQQIKRIQEEISDETL